MLQDAAWYDKVYADSARYKKGEQDAPWAPLWRRVAERVPWDAKVLDVGCGPGHMATYLDSNPVYTGIDFSKVAIQQASRRARNRTFLCADATTCAWPLADIYLFLEILEHVDHDTLLLTRVPHRRRVILSVPNFRSEGHVRIFKDAAHVEARYGRLFTDFSVDALSFGTGDKKWFILDGLRK